MTTTSQPLVRQRTHPHPYRHPERGLEGVCPIQIAPPSTTSPDCPRTRVALAQRSRRIIDIAEEEGEWVAFPVDPIPYDRVVDRDVILIGLAELWLARLSDPESGEPWIDARQEGVSYIAAHPAKGRMMSYFARPLHVSATWPASTGDKVFLDRVRKLARGGLLHLHPDPRGAGARGTDPLGQSRVYDVALTELGLARLLHLERRLRLHPDVVLRLRTLLLHIGMELLPPSRSEGL